MKYSVNNVSIEVTSELQNFLSENKKQVIKKPILSKKKNDLVGYMQELDEYGNPKFEEIIMDKYPFVYFGLNGKHYFNVFRETKDEFEDGSIKTALIPLNIKDIKELKRIVEIVNKTNKTEDEKRLTLPNLFGSGVYSHSTPIPGSDLWDNGKPSDEVVKTARAKGDPSTKIIAIIPSELIININVKPQDDTLVSKALNLSSSESEVIAQSFLGKETWDLLQELKANKSRDEEVA